MEANHSLAYSYATHARDGFRLLFLFCYCWRRRGGCRHVVKYYSCLSIYLSIDDLSMENFEFLIVVEEDITIEAPHYLSFLTLFSSHRSSSNFSSLPSSHLSSTLFFVYIFFDHLISPLGCLGWIHALSLFSINSSSFVLLS